MRRIRLPEEFSLPRVLDGPSALALFAASATLLAWMPMAFSVEGFAVRFFLAVVGLAAVLASVWLVLQLFKSRIAWSWFFAPVLGNLMLALAAALVLRALAVLLEAALRFSVLSHVVFSLTPLVVLVTFGWTVEKSTQLPERPAAWIGWTSVVLLAVALYAVDHFAPLWS
ncbi:hypothetical protein HYV43_02390 [Candidatus Micrarchaeota archaeon]|nr:hypothetical protein [Candidatus Micrarchaeota archaeon]